MSALRCTGCEREVPIDNQPVFRCPDRADGDDIDHVLAPVSAAAPWPDDDESNPFVRYRKLLHGYAIWRDAGGSDERFEALVRDLDARVAAADGAGFRETPLVSDTELDAAVGARVFVKDETGNVSGSHKARHLMGVQIVLEVCGELGRGVESDPARREALAIASCGNAALGAAVVARAAGQRLQVFVPPDAADSVVRRLDALGAERVVCPRTDDRPGDPCVHAFAEAVENGAVPYSVQGNYNGLAVDGGSTLAYELVDQLRRREIQRLDRLFVQVGGGALAAASARGFDDAVLAGAWGASPRLHAVQTEGGYPLHRAWRRAAGALADRIGVQLPERAHDHTAIAEIADLLAAPRHADARVEVLAAAARSRAAHMWPWEQPPASAAGGILDDETYDWHAVVAAMLRTGGWPVVVAEERVLQAAELGPRTTGVDADATGTSGLAGLLELSGAGVLSPTERVGVLFTGARR